MKFWLNRRFGGIAVAKLGEADLMEAESTLPGAWRFGRFTLDLARGALLADGGAHVPLRPKSMALLRLLVENAGRLLDRDAIMAGVWPDVVVGDESITQCVRDIRKALGDEAQQVLKTVPKRGYLLEVEVVPAETTAPTLRVERRLAAILAADVVGYSRLMERDEGRTLERLKALRKQFIEPLIAEHRGRVVKLMGDGALSEFGSVVDAVACAVLIQQGTAEREEGLPEDERIRFRIGVNLGDVIHEADGDIYGDGVNLATHLEQLSEPGGIVVSGTAYDHLGGKLDHKLQYLGERQVKNLERPVRVYRVSLSGGPPEPAVTPLPDKPSIAVLPFVNMSGDPNQEYFADGLTEDLITALAAWRSFPVIARNSTFTYKGRAVRVQQVADELGARYVLEGSVRKADDRVRVSAQLIDAETGHHVWANRFDRPLGDIFEVQDEITSKIATVLAPELTRAEIRRAGAKRPDDLTAWDLHLRGTAELNKQTCEGNAAARPLFERAIARHPDYADAWAGLALSHARDFEFRFGAPRERSLSAGFAAARRAVELDGQSAAAHMALGIAYIWAGDLEASLAEVERTLELNPYHAHAQMAFGNRLDLVGRSEEGIAQMKRSLDLNPRDPHRYRYMAFLSRACLVSGDPEVALGWIRKSLGVRSEDADLHFRHAICLANLDRHEEARAALTECERLRPGYLARQAEWRPYKEQARNERFFAGLKRHGLWP